MNEAKLKFLPSMPIEQEQTQGSDFNRLIAIFRRRIRSFAFAAAAVFLGVVIFTLLQIPRYTANATVMLDMRKHDVSAIDDVLSGLPADSSAVDTEVEILKSRSLAERVVQALDLEDDPEFNSKLRLSGPLSKLIGWLPHSSKIGAPRYLMSTPPNAASLPLSGLDRVKMHEAVIDAVLSHIAVKRIGLTYVIGVSFQSPMPAKAAAIANEFVEKYLSDQLEAKYEATQQATIWLNGRLAELEPQVQQSEAAVEQYKAGHGLLASVGSSMTEQEISNLNTQLDQAKADAAEKDAQVATAQEQTANGSTGENLAGPLASTAVAQLRTQKATISEKVADDETKYGPKHPAVLEDQRQLADINSQIGEEVSRQVSNIQAEDQIARQRVTSLEGSLNGAKGTLVGNNAASVELDDLQRKSDAVSSLYNSLLDRSKQTATSQGSEQSDARIVSEAKIPLAPSYPNKFLNITIGLILGAFAGVGAIFLLEALNNSLSTSDDIEHYLGVPHLGSIPLLQSTLSKGEPEIKLEPGDYVVHNPLSAFSEAFRSLRASIMFSNLDHPPKVIMLTSALPSEGKTTTSFCLGRSLALMGAGVVVVDCDIRRRNINKQLNIEPKIGLIEVLRGEATLEDALYRDEESEAYFLPLARSKYTPRDMFGSKAMDKLLAELRARFEFVLLDTAPILPVSDTRILAPKADTVVFLARWRSTPRKAIAAAFELLGSTGTPVAGLALTQVDVREQARSGYGDAGYYYNSYRKYYST